MRGRLVYDNQMYRRGGNYPKEVLYSCQLHSQEDYKDQELFKCECCSRMFRQDSMWGEIICNSCYDRENLRDVSKWIDLAKFSSKFNSNSTVFGASGREMRSLGLSEIFDKTLHVANRKNIPHTLQSYGSYAFDLNCTVPEEDRVDSAAVPLDMFRERNHQ